jgi:hypothetical protein
MANPLVTSLVADTWTKVATNVTSGYAWILRSGVGYLYTYRMTGQAAPADLNDAVQFEVPGIQIVANAAIDVYVRSVGDAGKIRFDT